MSLKDFCSSVREEPPNSRSPASCEMTRLPAGVTISTCAGFSTFSL